MAEREKAREGEKVAFEDEPRMDLRVICIFSSPEVFYSVCFFLIAVQLCNS